MPEEIGGLGIHELARCYRTQWTRAMLPYQETRGGRGPPLVLKGMFTP
jgi:hypothetical protein